MPQFVFHLRWAGDRVGDFLPEKFLITQTQTLDRFAQCRFAHAQPPRPFGVAHLCRAFDHVISKHVEKLVLACFGEFLLQPDQDLIEQLIAKRYS